MRNIKTLPDVIKFCATIGNLPTSYMESLSYEEQLLWLLNFLNKTILPTMHETINSVEELENWFNNLDVQEEINSKLDEMAESGELEEIIAKYLQVNGVLAFKTLNDLKNATNLTNGSVCKTLGKTDYKVGNGSFYLIRTLINTDVVDGINLVSLTRFPTLIAELIPDYFINNLSNSIDVINNNIHTINTSIDDLESADTSLSGAINTEISDRQTADGALQTQINTIVASAGTAGESSSEIVQARTNIENLTFSTLNGRISFLERSIPFRQQLLENVDLNSYIVPRKAIVTNPTNSPFGGTTCFFECVALDLDGTQDTTSWQWICQKLYTWGSDSSADVQVAYRLALRTGINPATYTFRNWVVLNGSKINRLLSQNGITRYYLSNNFAGNGLIESQVDLNTLINDGNYLLTAPNNINTPLGSNALILNVESNDIGPDSNNWITQTVTDIALRWQYQRTIRYNNVNPSTSSLYYDWRKTYDYSGTGINLTNKKVVNLGDSIIGNYRGDGSISSIIAAITNATVYNCGFGGTQMSDRNDSANWKAFSFCNLVDSIVSSTWTNQDNAIGDQSWSDKPDYFDSCLAQLKTIDFSQIDYVTISFGTNDYTAGDLLDDEDNLLNKNTVAGALRYGIDKLQETYPNLKILICSPLFRVFNSGGVITDSDSRTFTGGFNLRQMTEKFVDVGGEYHVPVLDVYNNGNINLNTYQYYLIDGTHPSDKGRASIGKIYANKLIEI